MEQEKYSALAADLLFEDIKKNLTPEDYKKLREYRDLKEVMRADIERYDVRLGWWYGYEYDDTSDSL